MMPLTFAAVGEENTIVKIGGKPYVIELIKNFQDDLTTENPEIGGKPEVKKHLENLGFVVGGTVKVVSAMGGNLIVNVKEARVGISQEMAQKIMI